MDQYKDYSAADFALDERFQKWVVNPDNQTAHFLNDLLKNFPDKKNEIEEAVQLVQLSGLSNDREANETYLNVWDNVRKNAERKVTATPWGGRLRYASVAAAAIAIVLVVTYLVRTGDEPGIEYKTAYAETKEIVLTDGSRVILNANSTLKLSESWNTADAREVFLEGEAFFNVVKTSDLKTFHVKIPGGIVVQVLGTTFNVNTRRENPSVYLESGQVKLHAHGEQVTLQPGERADYKTSLQKLVVSAESLDDANNRLAWRNNLYVINDFSLTTVARDIEDNFGKEVIILDSTLATKRITAKVPARELNVLLKVLTEALEIEIEEKGNQIIIAPQQVSD